MGVLTDRTASPKELAEEMDEPLNNVTYHVNVLVDTGMIELARRDTTGRSIEHFYRATRRAWFTREEWKQIEGPKSGVTAVIMGLMSEEVSRSVLANTFDKEENHISRTPIDLDAAGYSELSDLLNDLLEIGIFGIKERVAARMAENPSAETVQSVVNILQFDLPPGGRAAD
jgi:predicted ArsR family transcriptional regulator